MSTFLDLEATPNGTIAYPVEEVAIVKAPILPELNVTVRFKTYEKVEIELDADQLTWEDMKILRAAQSETDEEKADILLFDLLNKLTGQNMRKQPLRVINAVMEQLSALAGGQANPNA